MTRVERLLGTLSGEGSDTPVWTADISYWVTGNPGDRRAMNAAHETGYLELCDELRCMPYYWYDSLWAHRRELGDSTVAVSTDGETRRTVWTTGGRSIEQIERYSTASSSQAIVQHAVETREDLETLLSLIEGSELVVSDALLEYPERRGRWELHDGIPSVGLPRSPLSAFINEWAGVEHGMLLLFDEPDLCRRLFGLLEQQEAPILSACVDAGVPLVHVPDNLTSEVYTSLFDELMREVYETRLATLHRGGTRVAVHLDGTVAGLLPKLVAVGFDAVEAVTPAPVGDIDVRRMRRIAEAGSTALWGGIPGAMFAPPYSWQDMSRHLEDLLEVWRGVPFVLGVADQVPPDGDIDLVRRIADALD